MDISYIKTAAPFEDLFPVRKRTLEAITWDMRRYGYDVGKPLILWKDHGNLLIDGHTRLRAAGQAGLCNVPVVFKAFASEDTALKYAVRCQQNRRNLTDAELFACVLELSRKRDGYYYNNSAGKLATLLGISPAKIGKIRAVIDRAPSQIVAMVKTGRMTIASAYNRCVITRDYQGNMELNDLHSFCGIIHRRFSQEQIDIIVENLTDKEKNYAVRLCERQRSPAG